MAVSISFEMTDALAMRAAREAWLAMGRKLFTIGTLALVAVVTVIFVLAIRQNGPRPWLVFTGIPPVLFSLMVVIWVAVFLWLPAEAKRKLRHLPHRRVTIELTDSDFVAETATERLAVKWSELKEVQELPNFWLVSFKGGAQFPLPRNALSSDALAFLQGRRTA